MRVCGKHQTSACQQRGYSHEIAPLILTTSSSIANVGEPWAFPNEPRSQACRKAQPGCFCGCRHGVGLEILIFWMEPPCVRYVSLSEMPPE